MTKEQQDRYEVLKEYLRTTQLDTSFPISYIIRHGSPQFAEKLRQLFQEEQRILKALIEEL